MTSSLVGSEMCIRDRLGNSEVLVDQHPCGWSTHQGLGRVRAGWPSRHKAVSYTHLTLPTICSV
eukprot:9976230-Prorocentrum_lima.AAC.1